jgi:hypothetical protein
MRSIPFQRNAPPFLFLDRKENKKNEQRRSFNLSNVSASSVYFYLAI